MTPSPQGTTPSQAPAMSREEWTYRIDLIITWATNGFSMYDVSKRKADVLNAIMSLQAEVERLRGEVENRGKCLDMATESLRLIDSFDADDFGDPGSEARRCLKAIEKAMQPK